MRFMLLAVMLALALTVVGARRSRRENGRIDPFHPSVFPTIYVAVACLAPTYWVYTNRTSLDYLRVDALATNTPMLMALAVLGFSLGAAAPFRRVTSGECALSTARLVSLGRIATSASMLAAVYGLTMISVAERGADQDQFSLHVSALNAAEVVGPTGLLLIVVGRMRERRPLAVVDWALVVTSILALGLSGNRGEAIALMIIVIMYYIYRSASLRAMLALTCLVGFAYEVLVYRTRAQGGGRSGLPILPSLLSDLGSVALTTGHTAQLMNGRELHGTSLVADFVGQLPGPLVRGSFDGWRHSGLLYYRDLTDVAANQGFGFSIPAEGVLNWGAAGAFLLPFAAGLGLAALYARWNFSGSRPIHWAYGIAVAWLSFAWRSDVLGATKTLVYSVALMWLASSLARQVPRRVLATVRPGATTSSHLRSAGVG